MAGHERARALVIGGGVIGCAVLRELVRQGISDVVLVEAESDVCEGTSKANSAIVHTGFDAKPGTIEARLLRRAAELWPSTIDELGVPYLAVGALMIARTEEEAGRLGTGMAAIATRVGVETTLLDRAALRGLAPYVTDAALAALWVPDEGVIDPFWLTRAYAEAAVVSGRADVRLRTAVIGLRVDEDGVDVDLEDGSIVRADQVFDCAGLRADQVAALAGDTSFAITPRKGQFLVSEEDFGVDRIVLPIPGPMGKGMLVTPIVFGGILLGPTAEDITDKDDRATDRVGRSRILEACSALVPAVADAAPIRSFAGLRHVGSTGDYILRPSSVGDRLWIVAGIRSTGISASPAIAEGVVRAAMAARGWARPSRPVVVAAPPFELPEDPGEIVCLCRGVSRGEILAALRRPIPALTLDAVKRRGGAMFGDCQGSLCATRIAGMLAREQGIPITRIEQGPRGSTVFAGESTLTATEPSGPPSGDVIVIGGGRAGRAAADALVEAGLRPALVEHREGHTAIGIVPGSDAMTVLVQSAAGLEELSGRAIILATGGYIEPRGHRSIDGPRPSGIVTADARAVAAGLGANVEGRRVHVIGPMDVEPDAIRGRARLEAIRVDGKWIDCDTLVLADRRVANAMLLRSIGIVDGRPGIPAPVDAEGRLPVAGLYAAGCCVKPDIDHTGCAEDGASVAKLVALEIGGRAAP